MNNLWSLGEYSGHHGSVLDLQLIKCPFCRERNNFKSVSTFAKKKPNNKKTLNFDTLECGNCKGYVMVLWSLRVESVGAGIFHDFRVFPEPLELESFPTHWPEQVGRYWLQAKKNQKDENWDAALIMARSALQVAIRNVSVKQENKSLKDEIQDLSAKGNLPPIMREWSDHLRQMGNNSTHPQVDQSLPDAKDVNDLINFLDFLLEYLYDLPHRIGAFRKKNN